MELRSKSCKRLSGGKRSPERGKKKSRRGGTKSKLNAPGERMKGKRKQSRDEKGESGMREKLRKEKRSEPSLTQKLCRYYKEGKKGSSSSRGQRKKKKKKKDLMRLQKKRYRFFFLGPVCFSKGGVSVKNRETDQFWGGPNGNMFLVRLLAHLGSERGEFPEKRQGRGKRGVKGKR